MSKPSAVADPAKEKEATWGSHEERLLAGFGALAGGGLGGWVGLGGTNEKA